MHNFFRNPLPEAPYCVCYDIWQNLFEIFISFTDCMEKIPYFNIQEESTLIPLILLLLIIE